MTDKPDETHWANEYKPCPHCEGLKEVWEFTPDNIENLCDDAKHQYVESADSFFEHIYRVKSADFSELLRKTYRFLSFIIMLFLFVPIVGILYFPEFNTISYDLLTCNPFLDYILNLQDSKTLFTLYLIAPLTLLIFNSLKDIYENLIKEYEKFLPKQEIEKSHERKLLIPEVRGALQALGWEPDQRRAFRNYDRERRLKAFGSRPNIRFRWIRSLIIWFWNAKLDFFRNLERIKAPFRFILEKLSLSSREESCFDEMVGTKPDLSLVKSLRIKLWKMKLSIFNDYKQIRAFLRLPPNEDLLWPNNEGERIIWYLNRIPSLVRESKTKSSHLISYIVFLIATGPITYLLGETTHNNQIEWWLVMFGLGLVWLYALSVRKLRTFIPMAAYPLMWIFFLWALNVGLTNVAIMYYISATMLFFVYAIIIVLYTKTFRKIECMRLAINAFNSVGIALIYRESENPETFPRSDTSNVNYANVKNVFAKTEVVRRVPPRS